MIDPAQETLMTLKEAAEDFGGVSVPYNTVLKYAYRGVKGIKLETVFVNQRYTSREAIHRFIRQRQGGTEAEKPRVQPLSQKQVKATLKKFKIIK